MAAANGKTYSREGNNPNQSKLIAATQEYQPLHSRTNGLPKNRNSYEGQV
jgi:hypothetical protein